MVSLLIDFGVMCNRYDAVFLAGNHGYRAGLRDLVPHVVRVVGPVSQDRLPRPQVAAQQAGGLRAIPCLPPGQGQGTNPAVGVATQVELGGEAAPAAAERLPDGTVFFFAPAATWCARTAVE